MCGITGEEKFALEAAAFKQLKETLGDCLAGEEMEQLWLEYEAGETPEANLVKDFDKVSARRERFEGNRADWLGPLSRPPPPPPQIEMIMQASEYEGAQGSRELQEFFDSTAGKWRTELGRSWAEEVCRRRAARQAAAGDN